MTELLLALILCAPMLAVTAWALWPSRGAAWVASLPAAARVWIASAMAPRPIDWGTEPFEILRVAGIPPGTIEGFAGMTLIPPLAPSMGIRADLIIVPRSVYAAHREWVRETLVTRLKPRGRLVIVG